MHAHDRARPRPRAVAPHAAGAPRPRHASCALQPATKHQPCVFTAASMRAWALLAILPLASGSEHVSQRIWIQTWTVGATCSRNAECRSAAAKFLTNGTAPTAPWPLPAYQPKEVAIFAPVSFTDGNGAPVDLTDMHQLKGENFSQVNGVCASDAASLALHPQFPVKAHAGGCLSPKGSPPHAFLAALVQPLPATPTQHWGGTVRGCPHGLCITNVNVPPAGVSHATRAIFERTVVQVWCVATIVCERCRTVLLKHGRRPDLFALDLAGLLLRA